MTETEMIKHQISMQDKIKLIDKIPLNEVKTVTGIDSAYFKFNGVEYGVCCAVTIDRETKEVIDTNSEKAEITVRYISGLLSFREEHITLKTLKNLKHIGDVIFFDGNGILHERKMGIATHAGILLDKPTIGVAKNYYKIHDLDLPDVGESKFNFKDLVYDEFTYGRVLRTREGCKPIYVSCGNNITLETATSLVKEFIDKDSRVPAPTRLADIATHELRKETLNLLQNGR